MVDSTIENIISIKNSNNSNSEEIKSISDNLDLFKKEQTNLSEII